MNASSNISNFENNSKTTFWKKNNHVVPGRPSQKNLQRSESNRVRLSGSTSFQDFQESVSDAWELEDDDTLAVTSGITGLFSNADLTSNFNNAGTFFC